MSATMQNFLDAAKIVFQRWSRSLPWHAWKSRVDKTLVCGLRRRGNATGIRPKNCLWRRSVFERNRSSGHSWVCIQHQNTLGLVQGKCDKFGVLPSGHCFFVSAPSIRHKLTTGRGCQETVTRCSWSNIDLGIDLWHCPAHAIRLCFQGKLAEADLLYLQAVEIGEIALGPDHPDVGEQLSNRAEVLFAQVRTWLVVLPRRWCHRGRLTQVKMM